MGVLEVLDRLGFRPSSSPDKYTIVGEEELGHGTSGHVVIVKRHKDNKVSLHGESH